MNITWYGHSAFRIENGDANILIDPFLTGNPSANEGWEAASEGVTHLLLTHGHNDHVGEHLQHRRRVPSHDWRSIRRRLLALPARPVALAEGGEVEAFRR